MSELTADQQIKILQSHMFIVQKQTGETKARMIAGGNKQRGRVTKEESSSPTVSTEEVILTSIVDALEGRDVAVIDIPNAFIQTRVHDEKGLRDSLYYRSDSELACEGSTQSLFSICDK